MTNVKQFKKKTNDLMYRMYKIMSEIQQRNNSQPLNYMFLT